MVARLWADRLEQDPPNPKYNNFNQVPAGLRDQVLELLDEDGYMVLPDGSVRKKLLEDEEE